MRTRRPHLSERSRRDQQPTPKPPARPQTRPTNRTWHPHRGHHPNQATRPQPDHHPNQATRPQPDHHPNQATGPHPDHHPNQATRPRPDHHPNQATGPHPDHHPNWRWPRPTLGRPPTGPTVSAPPAPPPADTQKPTRRDAYAICDDATGFVTTRLPPVRRAAIIPDPNARIQHMEFARPSRQSAATQGADPSGRTPPGNLRVQPHPLWFDAQISGSGRYGHES